jgi:hypothetical protein
MTKPHKATIAASAEISVEEHRARMAELDSTQPNVESTATPPAPAVEPTIAPAPGIIVPSSSASIIQPSPSAGPASIGDVFSDPSKLLVPQNYLNTGAVKKIILKIPVKKPDHQEFVRVRPEPEWRSVFAFIRVKSDNEYYLVLPNVFPHLPDAEYKNMALYTMLTRAGALHLWPVPVRDADGKINDWHQCAHEAAERCMTAWHRIIPDSKVGGYELKPAVFPIPEPAWPDLSLGEVLRIAFQRFLIDTLDHPLLKKLSGEC